jgi:diguanylate cyclase (GGDEF)-like protein/PAS domain S-box-containing protein
MRTGVTTRQTIDQPGHSIMTLELIKAASMLLALSLLQGLIARYCRSKPTLGKVLSGVLFGGICVVGMMAPIEPVPGVIFDPRSVVLSMSGLFGGPVVGGIAAMIAGSYRFWLGGGGTDVGVAVVISCTSLGLFYRYAYHRDWVRIDLIHLLVFGLLVHLVEVALFTQLPAAAVPKVMDNVALPLILTFTPATAFLGLLLQDINNRLKTESDLRDSEARLSLHLQNTPLAAISWDRDFQCMQWNKAAEKIFGYSHDEAVGRHVTELIVPAEIKKEIEQVMQSLLERKGGEHWINENLSKDGTKLICEWYNTPISNERGETIGVVSLAEDITARKRAEDELKFKNTLLNTQQEASTDGIISVNAQGEIISVNQRCIDMWGYDRDIVNSRSDQQLIDSILHQLVDPQQFLSRIQYIYEHRNETSADEFELKDGRIFERHSAPMFGADNTYYGRVWMFRDVTQRKRAAETIWNQANFDTLTGLANRQLLRDRLEQEIKKARRAGLQVALLYLDLDQFKDVNDTLGHDIGDILLIEAARRLSACVREADTVARLGGDEFIVVMGELEQTHSVERVAGDILRQLTQPFRLGEETSYISASIGITFYPQDASSIDEMLRNADHAMYAAKNRGRNRYQYFTASMQQQAASRMLIAKDLRVALSNQEFQLCYQPIVALGTRLIHKAEALLRWKHPERGWIAPGEFIPVAEDTRLIVDIGDWVFREAVRQCGEWRARFQDNFQISINTSPVQYRSDNFDIAAWIAHLHTSNLPGQAIVVEITEGLLMDSSDQATNKLLTFRDAGIQVSLDDFGTGYSSLSYLKKFDIDYLKIDQSFVRNLQPESDDLALCEAIIVMAHKLGLQVVAEGIETEQQCDLLASAGCDYGQGYFFSRPLAAAEFGKLLAKPAQASR